MSGDKFITRSPPQKCSEYPKRSGGDKHCERRPSCQPLRARTHAVIVPKPATTIGRLLSRWTPILKQRELKG
jgi:hypothetical protein